MKEALVYATIGIVITSISFWIAGVIGVHWMIVMPICFAAAYGIEITLRWILRHNRRVLHHKE